MKDFGLLISQLRKERHISQEELAQMIKCTKQTISNYERNMRKPDYETLEAIADVLNVPMSFFLSEEEQREKLERIYRTYDIAGNVDKSFADKLPSNLKPIRPGSGQRVRVVGEVAAGQPIYMDEDYETYVDSPMKADFALVVRGDSMIPTYLDGDIVYIKQQSSVDDGQVAAVALDDSATLKHVYRWNDGLNLVSDNPKYAPIHVSLSDHEVRILGVVVGFTRMYAVNNKLSGVTKGMPINQP